MKLPTVAYFCMEFGLDSNFRIYSGGLGILAGDLLKAAHDVSYPMVGVGILWRQGLTSQKIDKRGRPVDCYHEYRYDFLQDTGVEVTVTIRERPVAVKVWLCEQFGNAPLYLLDVFLPENADSLLSGQLYGWFEEERIAQEIILGVGGVKALKKLGIRPDLYHFNDSHPVFAGLELLRKEVKKGGGFEKALEKVRKKIVFTTHTPVEAGNETHSHRILHYMGATCGFSKKQLEALGGEPFNMTVAGLRLSKRANGVSQLHGEVANRMWGDVKRAAPILAVTNGVHNGTWQTHGILSLAQQDKSQQLWETHQKNKVRMLRQIERRCRVKLNPDVLTIGFARRAATYKRGDLVFRHMELLTPLLESGRLQLIFSGKAHPNDMEGKEIVAKLYAMSKDYPGSVVFVQDYDMEIGALLTRGCDVWLNNPRRPMEACGTSGMKAAVNGVLNFSTLDGWWDEYCQHGINGWQIGDIPAEDQPQESQDEADSQSLYETLLHEVVPTYYDNREKWLDMMTNSITTSSERFSAGRMLQDYLEMMYLPE